MDFYILHTEDHNTYKNFCRKKRGSISISYVDILQSQDKYLVLENDVKSNIVLECELFIKIENSMISLTKNNKYCNILYYTDTLNETITNSFIESVKKLIPKNLPDLQFHVLSLDELDKNNQECLKRIRKENKLPDTKADYIQTSY